MTERVLISETYTMSKIVNELKSLYLSNQRLVFPDLRFFHFGETIPAEYLVKIQQFRITFAK
jgi:hypothetical protein